MVPDISYADALAILQGHMKEIKCDLPELAYYDLKGLNISGVAMREIMADSVDKVIEAQDNFETALVNAQKMALTIGSRIGLFSGIGNLDHTF
jgi:hypothetical protein